MEINGGVRQIRVAQQHLDRAQVGAGLQQVRRVRMAQRVRTDAPIDAGGLRGTAHRVPNTFGRERLVGTPAVRLSGEEIDELTEETSVEALATELRDSLPEE